MTHPTFGRRQFLQASALTMTGALLAACGAPVPPTAGEGGAPAVAQDTEAAAGESLLRSAFGSQRDDLSVFWGVGRVNADVNRRVFSSLTQFDYDLNLIGDLAETWTASDDSLTYTFNLRQGVTWHDGAPFTANDVAFTILRQTHPAVAAFYASTFASVEGYDDYINERSDTISGMSIPDDFTVVFKLAEPLSGFPSALAKIWMIPQHLLGEIAPENLRQDPFWSTAPVGTGSYKVTGYVPKQTIEYMAHENYHFGAPKIQRMIWTQIPEPETQLLALESGDIDYCQIGLTRDNYDRVLENPDLYIMEAFEPRLPQMSIHYGNFADKRVRQAICHAIDRSQLLDAEGGEGYATLMDYYFMAPWATEGAVKWGDVYNYDPDKARALLAEAGWDPNQEVELQTRSANLDAGIAITQELLQAVGINAQIFTVESTNPAMYEQAEYDLVVSSRAYSDPYEVARDMTCASSGPGGSSLTQLCSADYDALMAEEAVATTVEARGDIYRKLQEILVNEAVSVPTVYQPNRAVFNSRVQADKWAWYAFDRSWEWTIS